MTKKDKTKYDWSALRVEFMKSEHFEVCSFLRDKLSIINPYMVKRTKGWTQDKKLMLAKAAEKALLKVAKDKEHTLNILYAKMGDNLVRLVAQLSSGAYIDSDEYKTIWGLIRTELGMPTSITKQENVDIGELERAKLGLDAKIKKNAKTPATRKKAKPKPVQKRKVSRKPRA